MDLEGAQQTFLFRLVMCGFAAMQANCVVSLLGAPKILDVILWWILKIDVRVAAYGRQLLPISVETLDCPVLICNFFRGLRNRQQATRKTPCLVLPWKFQCHQAMQNLP